MTELWWRSYNGAPTNHKWAVIAKRSGVKTGIVSAIVWALLDYASRNDTRGSIQGFDTEEYAVYSGFDEEEIKAVIEALIDKGVLIDYKFANWDKRQPKSESEIERSKRNKAKTNQPKIEETEIPDPYDGCDTEYYGELQKDTERYRKVRAGTKRYAQVQKCTENYIDKEKEKEKELINSFPDGNECEQSSRVGEKPEPDPLKPFGKYRELAETFISSSGLKPVGKEYGLWNAALKQIAEAGITAEEIPRVVEYMRRENLTIGSPKSILNVGRDLKASGKINGNPDSWQFSGSGKSTNSTNERRKTLVELFDEREAAKRAEAEANAKIIDGTFTDARSEPVYGGLQTAGGGGR